MFNVVLCVFFKRSKSSFKLCLITKKTRQIFRILLNYVLWKKILNISDPKVSRLEAAGVNTKNSPKKYFKKSWTNASVYKWKMQYIFILRTDTYNSQDAIKALNKTEMSRLIWERYENLANVKENNAILLLGFYWYSFGKSK